MLSHSRMLIYIIILLFPLLSACTPAPVLTPTAVSTLAPTSTPYPTIEISPTLTITATPEGEYPQIVIGIPFSAVSLDGCGLGGITGRDFDSDPGQIASWYDVNPDIPKPEGFSIRGKDGRWDLDICTFVGFPVVFMQELGIVKQAREDYGVVDIQIVKGPGSGLILDFGHLNIDLDPNTEGIQSLVVGQEIYYGDLIGFTGQAGIPPSLPSGQSGTMIGILNPSHTGEKGWGVYHPDQEWMLIGPDGQVNILYDK